MNALLHFDLIRRGAADLVEQWQAPGDTIARVWNGGDVLTMINGEFFPSMKSVFSDEDPTDILACVDASQSKQYAADLSKLGEQLRKLGMRLKRRKDVQQKALSELDANLKWMKEVTTVLKKELAALAKIEKQSPTKKKLLQTIGKHTPPASWFQSDDSL